MRTLDWVVLIATLCFLTGYGLYRSRGSRSTSHYLLAGRTMPWYAMALSIMATQASAITFISTTGQGFVDGMRFVQFYFGLPLAMIIISFTAVPIFHRAGVYTAYEYLENRFDAKTRALVSGIFLIQRGLAMGVSLYAPALVLSVILGWSDRWTTILMGIFIVAFTVLGGIKAITWTDTQQMMIVSLGLLSALFTALYLMPREVGFLDAVSLAGAAGRINPVTVQFDWNDRFNLFSGLIGGMFLALAYFGCDQSQVQRYLTGKSIAQSRLSLLFNAVAKIPMQFFILLIGTMVFVFYLFNAPPILFHPAKLKAVQTDTRYPAIEQRYQDALTERRTAAGAYVAAATPESKRAFQDAHRKAESVRKEAIALAGPGFNDTNYIFLTFVTKYLPAGLVGLLLAAIFGAAITTVSGELNSLATVSVIDIYRRFVNPNADDNHFLRASQLATFFWGIYAIVTANFGGSWGALIETVNMLGSLFYGGLLGIFVLAFYFKSVTATPAFCAILIGEAAIFACWKFTQISWLWYNVVGCVVVIAAGLILQAVLRPPVRAANP